jgi:hypothetical protein
MTKAQKQVQLKINAKVKNALIKSFSPGSNLQKFIDMDAARIIDKYVPSDTASMRKSVFVRSPFGMGQLIYGGYYEGMYFDTKPVYQDRPLRGARWAERAMDSGGREKLMLGINRFIQKRGG